MSNNKSASFEARLKNSKDLVVAITGYDRYKVSFADIKPAAYGAFLNEVETSVTVFKELDSNLRTAKKENVSKFADMKKTARGVRSETAEFYGKTSTQYEQISSIVRVVTGENISKHSKMKAELKKALKEGEEGAGHSSVSRLDQKTMLGNFRQLIAMLKSFGNYEPDDSNYSITALEAVRDLLTASLNTVAEKETLYVNQRALVLEQFNGPGGIRDRANRAKLNVRRQYGYRSAQYKALVNKKY